MRGSDPGAGRAHGYPGDLTPSWRNAGGEVTLSGTVRWMFDRGLIGLSDDLEILMSRQANDAASIRALIGASGRANLSKHPNDRPQPHFLRWHREHCQKA